MLISVGHWWDRPKDSGNYNDSIENIEATAQLISGEPGTSIKTCLMPYYRLGEKKYARLESADRVVSIEPPEEEHIIKLKEIMESYGLDAQKGGWNLGTIQIKAG